jgi:hypothetical protein
MSKKRLFPVMSGLLAAAGVVATVSTAGISQANDLVCTWTGTAGDEKFSTASNWNGCGGSAPTAGDIIIFDMSTLTDSTNELTNDLNVSLAGVETIVSGAAPNPYVATVYISQLRLENGAVLKTTATNSNELGIAAGTEATKAGIVGDGSVEVNGRVFSPISAAGQLKVTRGSALVHDGAVASVEVARPAGSVAFQASSASVSTIQLPAPVTFTGTADGSAGVHFSGYCTQAAWNGCVSSTSVTYNATGAWTLGGNRQVGLLSGTTLKLSTAPTGGSLTKAIGSEGQLQIGSDIITAPVKNTELAGKVNDNVDVAENETATLLEGATRLSIDVYRGGVLKGVGNAGFLTVSDGGKVAPGMSPGCLTSSAISLSGEYVFELGGTDACTGYDQIVVTDPVPANAIVILDPDTAVLTTSRFNDYTPSQGQVFTILDNQGTNQISGTFKDLAEGATFEQNGVVFKVSYVGGTGNDITLTVQNIPSAPDTGLSIKMMNPVYILSAGIAAAALLIVAARRLSRK